MNIFNNYTDLNTNVSAANYKCSDDFYITIPEEGRSDNIKNDNIMNYLPTKKDKRQYKKVLNKFEDLNDSDVSTDIDSENEITDLPEPCDAAGNNTSKSSSSGEWIRSSGK